MAVVLTGGLGHIGSKLVIDLLQEDDVILIDSMKTQRFCSLFNLQGRNRCYFIPEMLQEIEPETFEKLGIPSSVIHLAADNDSTQIESDILAIEKSNNFTATIAATTIARHYDIPIVFASTTSVYNSTKFEFIDEATPKSKQLSRYAEIKSSEEDYIVNLGNQGLNYVILRLATIYGKSPGMRFHTAINKFSLFHSIGDEIEVWGSSLDIYRPYLSIMDACNGVARASKHWKDLPPILNLVTKNASIREIFEIIEKISNRKILYKLIDNPFQQDDTSFKVSNSLAIENSFVFSDDMEYRIKETLELFKGISVREPI